MSDISRRVLVVFVDALGPAQLARFGDRLAFLPHQRALQGILGYSTGALPTILTGMTPSVHGRMCLFSRRGVNDDDVLSPLSILGLLPRFVHERGLVRRTAAAWLTRRSGLSGYVALHKVPPEAFGWLDIPEREDLFHASMIGRARTFLADARCAGLSVFAANWKLAETMRWREAFASIQNLQPDLTFLYSAEIDGHLHEYGNGDARTDAVFSRIARRIARARELLAKDARPLVTILVGDHGMADVGQVVDPRPLVARLGIDRIIVDSTMLRMWADAGTLSRARSELERAGIPGSWLDQKAMRVRDVPVSGSPFGRALWLLPEGTIFAPSWVGGKARGMHGYDLGTQSTLASLVSDDGSISGCRRLTDVADVIRRHLGLANSETVCA